MLIAMAGLPGTGKSTLAARLAAELGAVVLDKDRVRAALFPPPVLDFSREGDDLTMAAIYDVAGHVLRTFPGRAVILDGRTFFRSYQVRQLFAHAAAARAVPRMIECVCAEAIVRARLVADQDRGNHPAANRSFDLYLRLQAEAEPLTVPHLVVDTGAGSPDECVGEALRYLRG